MEARESSSSRRVYLLASAWNRDLTTGREPRDNYPLAEPVRRASGAPQAETTFAVGEEAEHHVSAVIRKVGQVAAPLDLSGLTLQPGETTRIDVVVRTRRIGHFFPGGTVDAFDVWLELKAVDDTGRPIFWSGKVEDNGKGPVDPGAHFYRSFQLDAAGNPINKRNTFQTRSTLYVQLIPPNQPTRCTTWSTCRAMRKVTFTSLRN